MIKQYLGGVGCCVIANVYIFLNYSYIYTEYDSLCIKYC